MILDPDKLVGHAHLTSGHLVTVQVTDDDEVLLALYEVPAEEPPGDVPVLPAPVVQLTADEAELVASMVTLGAVTAYSRRNH